MPVGFLGPEGTWSHEALLAAGGAGSGDVAIPFPTIRDTILAVRDGAVDRALVPIDNALEGSVGPTIDTLCLEAGDVVAVGEVVHPISHMLVAREELELDAITRVVSHPQASAQSARFLAVELPHATVVAATSTAEAVRALGEEPEGTAALGSVAAARRYGAVILREAVEDVAGNTTRFLWLASSREGAAPFAADADPLPAVSALPGAVTPPGAAAHRTIVIWWGVGASTPGWLVACLSCFSSREINLTRIESRPHREVRGEFLFRVDLDGDAASPEVAAALEELGTHADRVRVVGSYPVAPG